jgi:hypothetical protein
MMGKKQLYRVQSTGRYSGRKYPAMKISARRPFGAKLKFFLGVARDGKKAPATLSFGEIEATPVRNRRL